MTCLFQKQLDMALLLDSSFWNAVGYCIFEVGAKLKLALTLHRPLESWECCDIAPDYEHPYSTAHEGLAQFFLQHNMSRGK